MAGTVAFRDELRLLGSTNTNKIMAGELNRLAKRALGRLAPEPRKEGTGALCYPFDPELAALAVRYHRTSARVLWDLYASKAPRLEPLYEELLCAASADTRAVFPGSAGISVEAYGVERFAAGARQIVGVVKNALVAAAAARGVSLHVEPHTPDALLGVRMTERGELVVSLDLAGRPTHQRGYRLEPGEAPLREDAAAGLVMLTRHDARSEALIDPMAGSGTVVIEAAGLARATPSFVPGREPLASRLPALRALCEAPTPPLFADTSPILLANELDPGHVRALESNLALAGESSRVSVRQGDFRDWSGEAVRAEIQARGGDPDRGVIVTNPPYGHRIGSRLIELYRDFSRFCGQFPGYRVGVIVANPDFERAFGREPRIKKPVRNGALKAYFLLYEI